MRAPPHPPPPPPLQDTEWLVRQAGGKAPATMQSFQKLMDKVGPPAAPLPAPAAVPAPAPGAPGAGEADTGVPTCQEMGFTQAPQAPFKVGRWPPGATVLRCAALGSGASSAAAPRRCSCSCSCSCSAARRAAADGLP
jgi:hypothetical protein